MANEDNFKHDPEQPPLYQIRLRGQLGHEWADWFGGMTITPGDNGETLLTGPLVDQAALHSLLKKVRDLGLPLLSLNQLEAEQTVGCCATVQHGEQQTGDEPQARRTLMKAVVYERYGPPEVLELREVTKPVPRDSEVLVKIYATTVTAADFRVRSFTVPPSYWLPSRLVLGLRKPKRAILGMELAGVVEAVGKNVTRFTPGDQVFALTGHHFGTYAEYICLSEEDKEIVIAHKPANTTFAEAAAIPFGGRTALYFLQAAAIKPGQSVLIYGASGCVGSFAVQLARYFGADVTGVCSTANLGLVRALGAGKVIDYTKEDFTRSGETYDVIFDTVGKSSFAGCVRSLKKAGVLLHAVATPAVALRMRWTEMISGKRCVGGGPSRETAELVFLKELVEAGKIRPVIDRCYPLEQIVEAHRYVDTGHKRGNVVITVQD